MSVGATVIALGQHSIRNVIDAHAARRSVRSFALQIGFSRLHCEELTIVASELCTNIVKYGVRGVLHIERLDHPLYGAAIVLDAQDEGPSFKDFEKAKRDRSDDRGTIPPERLLKRSGIGAGLGAVQRLTHVLWTEEISGGKSVIALRYVTPPPHLRVSLPR